MKQIPTGVDGLDKMLNGGLPVGRCILVCGGPGAGKTILSWHFLYYGAVRHNEPGLYVSLEEDISRLKEEIASFGWNVEKLTKTGQLAMVDASPIRRMPGEIKIGNLCVGKRDFSLVSLIEIINKRAEKIKAKRVVIDPITALTLQFTDVSLRRTAILDLFEALSKLGTTNLITNELRSISFEREIATEEFLADGVVVLHSWRSQFRAHGGIQVEKMRGITHDREIRPYEITKKGVEIFPHEGPLVTFDKLQTSQVQPQT